MVLRTLMPLPPLVSSSISALVLIVAPPA
jgi:hypothetical protein